MILFIEFLFAVVEFIITHPELGWIPFGLWLLFELRSKRGRIYQLDRKITSAIIVVRALARKEEAIDEEEVDRYLVENGMEPSDFFQSPNDNVGEYVDESSLGKKHNRDNKDERSTQ